MNPGQRRYDQKAWLGAHNAYADRTRYMLPNQRLTIAQQLNEGVSLMDLDLWLVRQRLVGTTNHVEFYGGSPTPAEDPLLRGAPVQVVAAHRDPGGGLVPLVPGRQYETLVSILRAITDFLASPMGQRTVVTIGLENHVASAESSRVVRAFQRSGAEARRFYLQYRNPAIPAPAGQSGGWWVRRFGAPSIKDMDARGKNLVVLPRAYRVRTVFGDASVKPPTWTDTIPGEPSVRDFGVEFFLLPTSEDLPVAGHARRNNSYPLLEDKLNDIEARWQRIPNFATFDFVELGNNLSAGVLGWSTRYFTDVDLERLWRRTITPQVDLDRQPSAAGWFHTNVHVMRFYARENDIPVREAVASSWMVDDTTAEHYGEYDATQPDFPDFTQEGRYTLGFCVVDRKYGRRSTHMLVPIRIDKTAPQVSAGADLDSLWPPNGKPVAVTVRGTAADALSGLAGAEVSYQVIDEYGTDQPSGEAVMNPAGQFEFTVQLTASRRGTDRDGRTYRVEVTATDNAGNVGSADAIVVVPHDQGQG